MADSVHRSNINDKPVAIGKLGKSHGIQGWLRFYSLTDPQDNALHYRPWLLATDSGLVEVNLENSSQWRQCFLVKLNAYDSINEVKPLANHSVYTWRQQFEPLADGEYYWADLIGLQVYNLEGQYLGTIDHLLATGANDVLYVKHDNGKRLVPYIDQVINRIDPAEGYIVVDWNEQD